MMFVIHCNSTGKRLQHCSLWNFCARLAVVLGSYY